jgi:hypothetical protein
MADLISPNMNLVVPTVGVTPGPTYAVEISSDLLTLIDAHDHSPGKGVLVGVNGLNINEDLPINNNNVNNARSYRIHSSGAVLSGGQDINCLYPVNGDLYWNNSSGTPVKITTASSINSTNTFYLPKAVSSNTTINAASAYVYYEVDTTSGSFTINLPSAALLPQGRFYFFKDVSGEAGTNSFAITANGFDVIDGNATVIININYMSCMLECDGFSKWRISYFSDPAWIAGNFINVNEITIQGSGVEISAASAGALAFGAAANTLTFVGASYDFGFESGNTFAINAFSTTINGDEFIVNSTAGSDFSTPVSITGTAFTCGGNCVVALDGNVTIGSSSANTLVVNSDSAFSGTVFIPGATTMTGNFTQSVGTVSISGPTTLSNVTNLTVTATSTLNTINASGVATFSNNVVMQSGANSLTGILSTSTNGYFTGRDVLRIVNSTASGTSTFSAKNTDLVYTTTNSLTATWQISGSGAGIYLPGDKIRFCNLATSGATAITVKDPAGNIINNWIGGGTLVVNAQDGTTLAHLATASECSMTVVYTGDIAGPAVGSWIAISP